VIVLTWLGTGDDRIEYYKVYRKIADDEDWQLIARVEATGDNRGWCEFRDTATERGITYIYGVSAVNTYGNKSTISESPAITSQ
jgi:fibronectin type 3 domain-containing protein